VGSSGTHPYENLGQTMKRAVLVGAAVAALSAVPAPAEQAAAQQPIKIGLILPYTGQFTDTAAQMDNAIKLYVKQHGDTVAGRKLEFIRKDTGGVAPDVAKRIAPGFVVNEKVHNLPGLVLAPNAPAASRPSGVTQPR